MLPPDRSPCRMSRLCRYISALAISRAVCLRARARTPTQPHACQSISLAHSIPTRQQAPALPLNMAHPSMHCAPALAEGTPRVWARRARVQGGART